MENRQWILVKRPTNQVSVEHFSSVSSEIPLPDQARGEVLIKTLMLSFDPAMRGWMDDIPSYLPPVALGDPMRAAGVGQVIQSDNPDLPLGTLVQGVLGWQEYVAAGPNSLFPPRPLPSGTPANLALSILGATSLTAYFGLLRIGKPQPGDTVLVSAAAGATGSVAAQIAKIKGCRVIGLAGNDEKCCWLRDELHLDAAINYKTENVAQQLANHCPDGIDVFFDNVGGELLQTVISLASDHARFVLCGAISQYNTAHDLDGTVAQPGPSNLFHLISKRIKMQGFIVFDYMDQAEIAIADLVQWLSDGRLHWREDTQQGFDNIPKTFLRLFDGRNRGKQLLKLADPDDELTCTNEK